MDILTDRDIIYEAYRLIRRKTRDALNPLSDDELGSYVRGVVDLQTQLYEISCMKENRND